MTSQLEIVVVSDVTCNHDITIIIIIIIIIPTKVCM